MVNFKFDVLEKGSKRCFWYSKEITEDKLIYTEVPFTLPIIQCNEGDHIEIPLPLDTDKI